MSKDGTRVFATRLAGLPGEDCPIPKCSAPTVNGRVPCTGWLEYRAQPWHCWMMESACPDHGPGLSRGGPTWLVVEEVMKEMGLEDGDSDPQPKEEL